MSIYEERISSKRTEALFLSLATLFLTLWLLRKKTRVTGRVTAIFFILFAFFVFYALNYRRLRIRLTAHDLELRFGIFSWTIPMDDIEGCHADETSLWRIGGAGIHLSWFDGRYRAMFNFLEYPRVVVALKEKRGPVRDVAFSTRHPQQVMKRIHEASGVTRTAQGAAPTKEDGNVWLR